MKRLGRRMLISSIGVDVPDDDVWSGRELCMSTRELKMPERIAMPMVPHPSTASVSGSELSEAPDEWIVPDIVSIVLYVYLIIKFSNSPEI